MLKENIKNNQGDSKGNKILDMGECLKTFVENYMDKLSGGAVRIYLFFLKKLWEDGVNEVRYSQSQLAWFLNISKSSVIRAISELEYHGLISKKYINKGYVYKIKLL